MRRIYQFVILALLATVLGVQTAGAADSHEDDHGAAHHQCCRVCQAGQMPALQAAAAALSAPQRGEWRERAARLPETFRTVPVSAPPRAPPV